MRVAEVVATGQEVPHPRGGSQVLLPIEFVGAHGGRDGHIAFINWRANENELLRYQFVNLADRRGELIPARPADIAAYV